MASADRAVDRLWSRVEALVDAASDDDVRSHRLQVLAARRRRAAGAPVPTDFVEHERAAAIAELTAPVLLERVARSVDEPLLLFKGPEVARLYPDPAVRHYWDVDLLVRDAAAVQASLLTAGFDEVGEPELYVDIHHLRPLALPRLHMAVEIHSEPKWPEGVVPPSTAELLAAARPRPNGPDGVVVLPAEYHAVVLAAHSWAHEPLRRLRDLLDIAFVAAQADAHATEELARSWGVGRLWRTTRAAIEHLTSDRRLPPVVRLWAANLAEARERTVLASHLERVASDFSALPFGRAVARLPHRVLWVLSPGDESWWERTSRVGLSIRNARRPRSAHEGEVDRQRQRSEP